MTAPEREEASVSDRVSEKARRLVANHEKVASALDVLGATELGDAEQAVLDYIAALEGDKEYLLGENEWLTKENAKLNDRCTIWQMFPKAAAEALAPLGDAYEFDDPDSLSGAITRLVRESERKDAEIARLTTQRDFDRRARNVAWDSLSQIAEAVGLDGDSTNDLGSLVDAVRRTLSSGTPAPLPVEAAEKTVNDCIVEFLDDCLSGGNDYAFRHTQHHDGARSQENNEDGTIVWINAAIGNPDEGGFHADGETFAEAMVEYIRASGTPKAVAELEEALGTTARNGRATQSEDSNNDASHDDREIGRDDERVSAERAHVGGHDEAVRRGRQQRGEHVRSLHADGGTDDDDQQSRAAREAGRGADALLGLHAGGVDAQVAPADDRGGAAPSVTPATALSEDVAVARARQINAVVKLIRAWWFARPQPEEGILAAQIIDRLTVSDAAREVGTDGVSLIAAERKRQTGDDAEWTEGQLADSAALMLDGARGSRSMDGIGYPLVCAYKLVERHAGDRVRLLTIAGAFIAAEIDRLSLASPTGQQE